MTTIPELLARAAALREETALNSISPERAGGIMYDTIMAINELWLQQGSALVISKIYSSVSAMEADDEPVSDITGQPLRAGQIVVIASSDSDNGSVYRFGGISEGASVWALVGLIGNITPVDALDSDSTQLPLAAHQGKVLDGKISQLGQEVDEISAGRKLFSKQVSEIYISIPSIYGKHIVKVVAENNIPNLILALNTTGSASGTTTYIVNEENLLAGTYFYEVNFAGESYMRAYSISSYPSGLSFSIYDKLPNTTTELVEKADSYTEKHTNSEDFAELGAEILPNGEWTKGDEWSGNLIDGYTHSVGSSGTSISQGTSNLGTDFYLVSLNVVSPDTSKDGCSGFTISIGGSVPFEMYEGNFAEHTYYRGIQANGSSGIVIKATASAFAGTIKNISLKRIEGETNGTHKIYDESNNLIFELKGTNDNESIYLGRENDTKDVGGIQNVGVGVQALKYNTTGFWNVAIGHQALRDNSVGSRNVGIGYVTLVKNTSGHRNIAIGSFSMVENETGANNIAIGADSLQRNISGQHNIALGTTTMGNNQAGNKNIAVGYGAMLDNQVDGNIGIGSEALQYNSTGIGNVVIGTDCCKKKINVSQSVVIGYNALSNNGDLVQYCVIIGSRINPSITELSNIIAIGHQLEIPNNYNNNAIIIGDSSHSSVIIAGKKINFNQDGSVTWEEI